MGDRRDATNYSVQRLIVSNTDEPCVELEGESDATTWRVIVSDMDEASGGMFREMRLGGSLYPIQRLVVGCKGEATTQRLIVSNTDEPCGR